MSLVPINDFLESLQPRWNKDEGCSLQDSPMPQCLLSDPQKSGSCQWKENSWSRDPFPEKKVGQCTTMLFTYNIYIHIYMYIYNICIYNIYVYIYTYIQYTHTLYYVTDYDVHQFPKFQESSHDHSHVPTILQGLHRGSCSMFIDFQKMVFCHACTSTWKLKWIMTQRLPSRERSYTVDGSEIRLTTWGW